MVYRAVAVPIYPLCRSMLGPLFFVLLESLCAHISHSFEYRHNIIRPSLLKIHNVEDVVRKWNPHKVTRLASLEVMVSARPNGIRTVRGIDVF